MRLTQEQIDRFWTKVDKRSEDECWNWLAGSKNKEGYGGFYLNQIDNTVNCHKISFILKHNFDFEDIPKGMVVRHSCNNPKCVNPKHLKLGTYKDNSQDMVLAGNSVYGVKNSKSKLTLEQVKELREKWGSGKYSQYDLVDIYNIKQSTVAKIISNVSYKDTSYIPPNIPHHGNKLTENKVIQIRQMHKDGFSVKHILSLFDIQRTQYYNIIKRRQWQHV